MDGEDYGSFDADGKDVLLGFRYFGEHLPDSAIGRRLGLDMIGKEGVLHEEQYSLERAPEDVVVLVWKQAQEAGYASVFVPAPGVAITDDDVPLLEAGLHVIDVIDYDYPEHHTTPTCWR